MTNLGEHYGQHDLTNRILARLTAAGIDIDALTPAQLSGVDEFHLGGAAATTAVLDGLDLAEDAAVLDVGSGIGGAARHVAARSRRQVTGIDLTPDFVALATELSARTGMNRTSFEIGDATDLRFADDTFDAVTLFHVGMNIEDKASLFNELARVVRPDGAVVVYDIMRIGDGSLAFPVPWSSSPATSHLASPADYLDALRSAGLQPSEPLDRRALVRDSLAAAANNPPPVDLSDLMGADWPHMFANLRAALGAGVVAPMQIIAKLPGVQRST